MKNFYLCEIFFYFLTNFVLTKINHFNPINIKSTKAPKTTYKKHKNILILDKMVKLKMKIDFWFLVLNKE